MNDKGDERHYLGTWSPERGFEPVDLENLIPWPRKGTEKIPIYMSTNYDRLIYPCVDSIEEGDLEKWARRMTKLEQQSRRKIEIAPGYRLLRVLGSICPPSFRERELDALHADAIELYVEKLDAGDKWGAWRVKWSMRGWMLWTVFGGAAGAVFSMVMGKHKPSK